MSGWDRNEELGKLSKRNLDGSNLAIAKMWIFHRDLEFQSWKYANAKSEYGRRFAKVVIQCRLDGSAKSDETAKSFAEMDDEVYAAHQAYRLAEQMVTADREALKILHAELDAYRTARADARMADEFQARTSI